MRTRRTYEEQGSVSKRILHMFGHFFHILNKGGCSNLPGRQHGGLQRVGGTIAIELSELQYKPVYFLIFKWRTGGSVVDVKWWRREVDSMSSKM